MSTPSHTESETLGSGSETSTPVPVSMGQLLTSFIHSVTHKDGSQKRKRPSKEKTKSEPGLFLTTFGRSFGRLGDPFTKASKIIDIGLEVEGQDSDDDEVPGDVTTESLRRAESWKILCKIIPGFREEMISIATDRGMRRSISLEISRGVDNARSDDTSTLKNRVLSYLLPDITAILTPPIPPVHIVDKSLRGWNHAVTAALLTPLAWDTNDIVTDEIKSGQRKVTAYDLPRFLYPDGQIYDPDDLENGLFGGHLLIRTAKCLFLGPSMALRPAGSRRGRSGVGEVIDMSSMTPRSLAYTAVQTRFSISDVQEWAHVDRDFNYPEFFWFLVTLLEGEDGKEILRAFDREVFGAAAVSTPLHLTTMDDVPRVSTLDRIMAQRATKHARLAIANPTEAAQSATVAVGPTASATTQIGD